jgi:menaquinol-cytochrome c reductase cytochrome b subunit
MPKLRAPKLPDSIVPAPLRKPAKPGRGKATKGQAPSDLKTAPPARQTDLQRIGEQAKEAPVEVLAWVDQRTGASGFLTGMLFRKVPKGTNWFYTLGSATLFAFIVQAVTGVFLAMFYTPSATQAYASISHINEDVPLGQLVHGMHKWGASVMVILIFVHMGRTFFFGAYKYPRELNWVIGVVLLILTMTMAFTGYLLPFDQRSYWASIVGININGTGPIVGPYLSDFLRAGPELGATTLARFYAIHMLLVPGAIIALIGAHMYLVVKLGTTAPPWVKPEKPKIATPVAQLDAGVGSNGTGDLNGAGRSNGAGRTNGVRSDGDPDSETT